MIYPVGLGYVGGLGINLTAADTCILFDSDWNPHQDSQAQVERALSHSPTATLLLSLSLSVCVCMSIISVCVYMRASVCIRV